MTTVAAGSDIGLVVTFDGGDLDATPEVTITPVAGGAPVVGPTSTGVAGTGAGRYTYVWSVPSATTHGSYTVEFAGLDGGDAVSEELIVTVTNLPVYTTLALLKHALSIEASDTSRDDLLTVALQAGARGIDKITRGAHGFWLDTAVVTRVLRTKGRVIRDEDGDALLVPDIGDTTGMIVEVGDGTSYTAVTDYETEPDMALDDGWPITVLRRPCGGWDDYRARITALWGWPGYPDDVAEANLIQSARLFRRNDSPEGVMGSADWGVIRIARLDPDVRELVKPFELPGFA